jgi:hypothetical protein
MIKQVIVRHGILYGKVVIDHIAKIGQIDCVNTAINLSTDVF